MMITGIYTRSIQSTRQYQYASYRQNIHSSQSSSYAIQGQVQDSIQISSQGRAALAALQSNRQSIQPVTRLSPLNQSNTQAVNNQEAVKTTLNARQRTIQNANPLNQNSAVHQELASQSVKAQNIPQSYQRNTNTIALVSGTYLNILV